MSFVVVVLISRLGVEHFVGKAKVIIRTCEKMVFSAIWNGARHLIVKDDLLAGLVTLGRATCHLRCHSRLTIPQTVYGNCSLLLSCGKEALNVTALRYNPAL